MSDEINGKSDLSGPLDEDAIVAKSVFAITLGAFFAGIILLMNAHVHSVWGVIKGTLGIGLSVAALIGGHS